MKIYTKPVLSEERQLEKIRKVINYYKTGKMLYIDPQYLEILNEYIDNPDIIHESNKKVLHKNIAILLKGANEKCFVLNKSMQHIIVENEIKLSKQELKFKNKELSIKNSLAEKDKKLKEKDKKIKELQEKLKKKKRKYE